MTYGRLLLRDIAHHTGFTYRQIKHSLAVLIQQHLAFWNTDPESAETYYEANWVNAYALVRWGKSTKAVEDHFAEDRLSSLVGSLFPNFLTSGHLRVADLEKAYGLAPNEKSPESAANSNQVNGVMKESAEDLHVAIRALIGGRFLAIVHQSNFRSEADNRIEAERSLRGSQSITGMLKGKEKASFDNDVDRLLLRWKRGQDNISGAIKAAKLGSAKRAREEESGGEEVKSKKRRQVNGTKKGQESTLEAVKATKSRSTKRVHEEESSDEEVKSKKRRHVSGAMFNGLTKSGNSDLKDRLDVRQA